MRKLIGLAIGLTIAGSRGAHAQTTIETPKQTIELIGLKRWTVAMINDSLAKYAPTDSLTGHACAAILRGKLHFADASVSVFDRMTPDQKKPYVAITLVEPQDSILVRYKPEFTDSLPLRAEWTAAYDVFKKENQLVQRAIQTPAFFDARLSADDSTRFAKLAPLHELVAARPSPAELAQLMQTLDHDGNAANRTIALLLLTGFADKDSAWWAAADALRDPSSGMVNATASQILSVMSRRSSRHVDWAPVAERVRYVIDGTNLFGFDQMLRTLTATSVSPSLAPTLLAHGGTLLSAKLRSTNSWSKQAVAEFVAQLSGLPATADASRLEAWLERPTVERR